MDEVIRREHEDYEAQADRRAYYGCHRGDAKSVMRDRVRACVLALVCRGWVGAGQAGKGGAITQVWIMSKRCNVFRGFQPKYCMLITLWYAGLLIRDEILKNLTPKSVVCSTKYHNYSCTYKPTTHKQSAKNLI